MVPLDQDDQDARDAEFVEFSIDDAAKTRHEHQVKRLLKQGFRHFRVAPRGPRGFVLNYSVRHQVVELEFTVARRKGKKGQRLKKPRIERVSKDFPFHKLHLVARSVP